MNITFLFLMLCVCIYSCTVYSDIPPVIGIVNPIEAKVRKGKGAVGAYGNERTQQSLQDFPVVDSEEEEEEVHPKQYPFFRFCSRMCFFLPVMFIYY